MLVQLLPENVSSRWEFFAPILGMSLPPNITSTIQGMSSILSAIMREDLAVWVYDDDGEVVFVMSTVIQTDPVTYKKSLLIYSLTGIRDISDRMWKEAYETIRKYARYHGCENIIAYTENEKIVNYINNIGGKATFKLIQLEV